MRFNAGGGRRLHAFQWRGGWDAANVRILLKIQHVSSPSHSRHVLLSVGKQEEEKEHPISSSFFHQAFIPWAATLKGRRWRVTHFDVSSLTEEEKQKSANVSLWGFRYYCYCSLQLMPLFLWDHVAGEINGGWRYSERGMYGGRKWRTQTQIGGSQGGFRMTVENRRWLPSCGTDAGDGQAAGRWWAYSPHCSTVSKPIPIFHKFLINIYIDWYKSYVIKIFRAVRSFIMRPVFMFWFVYVIKIAIF